MKDICTTTFADNKTSWLDFVTPDGSRGAMQMVMRKETWYILHFPNDPTREREVSGRDEVSLEEALTFVATGQEP